jgi:alkylresorcinol/alkylpyrone synthase
MQRRDEAPWHAAICGVATALPEHRYGQRELALAAEQLFGDERVSRAALERFFRRVGVEQRFLSLPVHEYAVRSGLKARNEAWLETALPLAETVVRDALSEAGVEAGDVGAMFGVTSTGIAVPSLEARLMNRLPLRASMKRVPLFGLGCLGGAAGVARAADYLRAHPREAAVLLTVELCSLTVQREDVSVANIISAGLFGDGAAAVVLLGAEHPGASERGQRVVDSLSHFFPDTERMMGWDVVDGGFKIVLSPDIPVLARERVSPVVDELLARNGVARTEIGAWIVHPGGPAVMKAMVGGLGLPTDALRHTERSLAQVGNLSSASVLFLLDDFRRRVQPARGAYAVILALGPAFSAEAVLVQW